MSGLLKKKCCGWFCWYCHADCCHSTGSYQEVSYNASGLLAAYVAAFGADDPIALAMAPIAQGSFTMPFVQGETSYYWQSPLIQETRRATVLYSCATPQWSLQWSGGGLGTIGLAAVPGGCCGTGGEITVDATLGQDFGHTVTRSITVSIRLRNNRCQAYVGGDLLVQGGTLADGDYYLDGEYLGRPTYRRDDGLFYIWFGMDFGPTFEVWYISEAVGTLGAAWTHGGTSDPFHIGSYTPFNGADGVAVVGYPPSCVTTEEDQCP